jgi:hypothetical protein
MVHPPDPSPHQSTGNNKTQVRVPLFLHSTRVYRCRKTPTLFPVHRSEHTPHPSRYPRGLPLGLDISRVLLSKDTPVIPSPSIRTYPSSLSIPQRPPTRPRHLPRPVVGRCSHYSQSIDPNIPLIPLDIPEASHSASTSPASGCRKRPPLFPVHQSEHTPHPSQYPRGFPLGLNVYRVRLSKDAPLFPVHRSKRAPHPSRHPRASHSTSTSSVSLVSPQTPPDAHRPGFVKVVSADSSLVKVPVIPHSHGLTSILQCKAPIPNSVTGA